ncbi:LPXTG cell wall anchor domain-containing protein [Streptomyces sp. NPDC051001]|uniref:LPXTG cell wall anchor domain-containing protein n=1 Tax=Streptomyces sp. NPDC051001 TaxID=3155795 RepID=UPI00341E22A3
MVASSAGLVLTAVSPAAAADTATGPEGQKLTVSRSAGLDPAGETVTVSGTGYNTEKGIYVAFCVDNGADRTPTPCVGGVDMSGESGASAWVSSDPPSYGEGLAKPYKGSGHDGSFSVRLKVRAEDANTDCTKSGVTCAVITRNDHTRGGDQSQTVRIPVTFGGAGSSTASSTPSASATVSTTGGGGATGGSGTTGSESTSDGPLASTGSTALTAGLTAAGLVAAGTGTWLWARRRRTATTAG